MTEGEQREEFCREFSHAELLLRSVFRRTKNGVWVMRILGVSLYHVVPKYEWVALDKAVPYPLEPE